MSDLQRSKCPRKPTGTNEVWTLRISMDIDDIRFQTWDMNEPFSNMAADTDKRKEKWT